MSNDNKHTVDLVDPQGALSEVPEANAASALQNGFSTPTPEEKQHFIDSKVYGSHFLLAGGAAFTRGALPFGIGAKLLQTAGLPDETAKKLEEHNPFISGAGELAGAFTPETGLAHIAGGLGKYSAGLAKMVGLGEDAGLAGKIGEHMVRGGAEGTAFGASKVANDAVVGDPNIVAQHALNEIGTSTLWGAGIGGALGIGAMASTKNLPRAKEAFSKLGDLFGITDGLQSVKEGATDAFASASSKVSGIPKDSILAYAKTVGREDLQSASREVSDSLQEMHGSIENALKTAIKEGEGFGVETNQAIHSYLEHVDSVQSTGSFAKQFMYKGKDGLSIDPTKVEAWLKNSNGKLGEKGATALSGYLEASQNLLGKLGEEGLLGQPHFSPDIDGIKELITKNKSALEQQGLAEQAAAFKQQLSGVAGLGKIAGAGALAHAAGLPGAAVSAAYTGYQALRNPIETLNRLSQLQKLVTKSANTIGDLTEKLASGKGATGLSGIQPSFTRKKYDDLVESIESRTNDFSGSIDHLQHNTASMQPHAPAVVSAMQTAGARALSFLQSKIPPLTAPGPLAHRPEPSKADIAAFSKYYQAVEKPSSVLQSALSETLTHEGIEALTVVHPELFEHMKQSIISSLGSNKKAKDLPYSRKLMLTLLLGQDLDGSTNPLSMHLNQQMLDISGQQAEAKEQAFIGKPKVNQKGLEALSASEQALTAQQASAQRTE